MEFRQYFEKVLSVEWVDLEEWTLPQNGLQVNEDLMQMNLGPIDRPKLNRSEVSGSEVNRSSVNGSEVNGSEVSGSEVNGLEVDGLEFNGSSHISSPSSHRTRSSLPSITWSMMLPDMSSFFPGQEKFFLLFSS